MACNGTVDAATAAAIAAVFTEVVAAHDFTPQAREVLSAKKNLRLLRVGARDRHPVEMRPISGGLLLQSADRLDADGDDPTGWRLVAGEPAADSVLADLEFAWRACRSVKSNAILLAADGAAVGIGMGQVNRVDSARLAVARAGADRASGSVAASDAFFPFPDGLEVLIEAGVRAVVQPGGSIRDEEVISTAAAAGVTMYLTGVRHFCTSRWPASPHRARRGGPAAGPSRCRPGPRCFPAAPRGLLDRPGQPDAAPGQLLPAIFSQVVAGQDPSP